MVWSWRNAWKSRGVNEPMNEKKTTRRYAMEDVPAAAELLKQGGLVAVPTETVYGLAARAGDDTAVRAIYAVKGRSPDKPLSILVSGMEMVERYTKNIPAVAWRLAEQYWPGPLTMVLEDGGEAAPTVTRGGGTLGVRCPDHPMTLALIRALGEPLAAPSANPSDQPSAKTAGEVLDYFDGKIEAVLDGGACGLGVESTIVALTGEEPRILREGGIPGRELLDFIKEMT